MTVSCNLFLFLTVSVKCIQETKNRVKSDLEATIKATDSKHAEVVTAIDLADSKKKEMELDIGLKHQDLKRALATC